jgi:hypothetical protein
MEFREYVEKYHKEVAEEYDRYINEDKHPKVGDTVVSLVYGYGGPWGVRLKVSGENNEYYELVSGGYHYLCMKSNWWKQIKVLRKGEDNE